MFRVILKDVYVGEEGITKTWTVDSGYKITCYRANLWLEQGPAKVMAT